MVGEIFIPIVIILVGVSLITISKIKVTTKGRRDTYFGIFSSNTEKISNIEAKLNCIAIFEGK